jgi:long-chain acyl-CoA synthetase
MEAKDAYAKKPWVKFYSEGVRAKIKYEEICLNEILDRTVSKFGEKEALIFQGFRMTYNELNDTVNRLAFFLHRKGIKKGDVVSILLPNMIQTVAAYYAVVKIGAIVQMNNPLYTDRELAYQFNDSNSKFLICLDLLAKRMINLQKETKIKEIVYTSIGDYLPPVKKVLFKLVAKKKGMAADVPSTPNVYPWFDAIHEEGIPPAVKIKFEDTAAYQYTGGTTGAAKGVILSHKNLSSMVQMYQEWFPDLQNSHDEIVISAPPIFHVLGMSAAMNLPISMGWTSVMVPKPQPKELLEATRKYKPTFSPMVPTMYVGMLQHPDLKKTDMKCYKLLTSGGSSLPVEVLKQFKELTGADINEGFGMTETSPQTHLNPGGGVHKAGSIGIPYPDTEVKIVDIKTGKKSMPVGKEGEMLFKGPQVTKGYLNKPDETKKAIRGGWLYSGDIAYMDKDGYFFIVDRLKDLIISGGYNVYPREIEEVLYEHPKIQKAAAIGIPDAKKGEAIKVFIVPNEGATIDSNEIMEYCKDKLAKYKWPSTIEIRSSLPESTVGKILKKDLKEEESKKKSK